MKTTLGLFALLFASACSGPEVPSAFEPNSPASPEASPAPRLPVAAVLAASNPLEASVCVPGKLCALPEAQEAPAGGGHQHGGHDHGNHGGMNHGGGHDHAGHGNHGAMNHGQQPNAPAMDHSGHDHAGHGNHGKPAAPPQPEKKQPPAGHEGHSGHNH